MSKLRRKTRFCIYATEEQVEFLANKYRALDTSLIIFDLGSLFEVRGIYSNTPNYDELVRDIEENNFEYTYSEYREYTKSEMVQAEYFHVSVPYPWEEDPENDAEFYGTEYISTQGSKCVWCRQQKSELRINTKKMGKYNFARIIPELIVSELTKNIIEEHGFSGCRFYSVQDYKGRESKPYYQLEITNILPPISPTVRMEVADMPEQQCPRCPYVGFRRSEFIYEAEKFGEQMDFNLSYERFDAYKAREVIVSSMVKAAFDKNKIKVYRYEPIRFI